MANPSALYRYNAISNLTHCSNDEQFLYRTRRKDSSDVGSNLSYINIIGLKFSSVIHDSKQ